MPIKVQLVGENGQVVKITPIGQLIVAARAYDDAVFKELAEDNTAYNFYKPKPGKQFIITGVHFRADRDVSPTTDAVVIIYEADSESTLTVDKVLFQDAMIKGHLTSLSSMNLQVAEGKFVNAKTSDDDIHMTIFGYYIPKVD